MTGATNVTIYRCRTCNDVVLTVPPGFEGPSAAEIQAKADEHNKEHNETRTIVEGTEEPSL